MQLTIDNIPVHVELSEELEDLARIIGDDEKTLHIFQEFQGMNLYFSQKIFRVFEQQKLQAEYQELQKLPNLNQSRILGILANRYGKSKRWIRELVFRGSL